MRDQVLRTLSSGESRTVACRNAGLDPSTLYMEMRRDRTFAASVAQAERDSPPPNVKAEKLLSALVLIRRSSRSYRCRSG
jgi:hypothetical protein